MQESIHPQADAKPKLIWVITLRAASLGVSYGLWELSRWLYTTKLMGSTLGMTLFAVSALVCAFFLFLAAVAPDKVVIKIWKFMGKGILYIMMFS